jgi:Mycothiol maleylpyruvate isomerase N-terminal domain
MRARPGVLHDDLVTTPNPSAAPVEEAYDAFVGVLREVADDESWNPTGCEGWAVRDLAYHHLLDAQRALVALHTPAQEPADRDAVSYWQDWAPDPVGSANHRRYVRVVASMFSRWDQLRDLHAETCLAVLHAARSVVPERLVRTQGHVLTAGDLLSTLCVEATIHHLDLVIDLPGARGPAPGGLTEVRRVLDALVGEPVATSWSDERSARVATSRARPSGAELHELGSLAGRFPVFS